MCLIIIANKKFPAMEILKMAEQQNGDGGGIAWRQNGTVRWNKGIKAEDMDIYAEFGPPWIIHFRVGTVGPKSAELTHPFPIDYKCSNDLHGSTKQGVLMHNGNWISWHDKMVEVLNDETIKEPHKVPAGAWSDSRAMAWLTSIKGHKFIETLHEKVAVLTPDDVYKYGYGWHEDEKNSLWFSYNPFMRQPYRYQNDWNEYHENQVLANKTCRETSKNFAFNTPNINEYFKGKKKSSHKKYKSYDEWFESSMHDNNQQMEEYLMQKDKERTKSDNRKRVYVSDASGTQVRLIDEETNVHYDELEEVLASCIHPL